MDQRDIATHEYRQTTGEKSLDQFVADENDIYDGYIQDSKKKDKKIPDTAKLFS